MQIDDTAIESNFLRNPLLPQTRSELAVPLIVGDRVLGVLDVQDDQPNRFSQSERDTLNTLAGQIATALQTAGLFEESQARLRVSQTLAGTQTEEQVLDAMMQAAALQPQALCAIYTFDQEAEELTAIVRRSDPFESGIVDVLSAGTRIMESQSSLFQYITSGDSFVTTNFVLDARADDAGRGLAKMQGLVSMAFVPIMLAEQLIGVVAASSRIEGYFDERQLHLYQALAEQGAVTLRTGRFYDELQRTFEQLRELDRLKSEFLSNMSHELRTPLNSIIGYTEIMLMGIDGEMDPETTEDVEAIHSNGRHLLRLINDVLDMAKIDAGRMLLNIEENYLEPLLEEARGTVATVLADKPVELMVEIEDGLPPIEGDAMRLTQILRNLVTNAGQFTDKGAITLRAYSDPSSEGDRICIAIEDTGAGIDESNMAAIFDRFQQVDGSQTRVVGGTGLGLSITQQLVHLHGGAIEVQSKVGVGSTFTVRLPVRHAA